MLEIAQMASGSAPAMMTVEGSIDSVLLSDCNLSPFGCVRSVRRWIHHDPAW